MGQLQNAFDIVQKAGLLITVSHIHLYSGLAHLALGDVTRASGRLRQALNLYRELDAVEFVHYALTALGMLAQAQAQPARAGRLLGAAEMLRERAQKWPWFWAVDRWYWVMNRRVHERLVQAVSSLRDDPATAGAWVEGRQMAPDEAVAYALQCA